MSHDLILGCIPNSLERTDLTDERYEAGKRLRNARLAAGFSSVRDFAESCGFNVTTCAHHENGRRSYAHAIAVEYARYLGVSPSWLLFGDTSQPQGICRIVGYIGARGSVTLSIREGVEPEEVPGVNGNYDVLTVHGDAMDPYASAGDKVYFDPPRALRHFEREEIDGNYCVVYLRTSEVLVRQVIVQTETTVTLLSLNGQRRRENVHVVRISPIEWVRKQRVNPLALRDAAD
jgi:transcriptional regulator with XRE-family HTH domain